MKMEAASSSETMVTYIPNFVASHPEKVIFIVTDMRTSDLP
jgi:hypothetical protein